MVLQVILPSYCDIITREHTYNNASDATLLDRTAIMRGVFFPVQGVRWVSRNIVCQDWFGSVGRVTFIVDFSY